MVLLASFRERGSSLSGDPCLWYVGGSVARGFFFLSVLLNILRFLCCCSISRQSILWRSKLRADPVLVFLLNGQERIVRRGGYALRAVSLPCRQAREARHHSWYGTRRLGLLVLAFFPSRGAPLGVSGPQMPVIMAAWTTGQCGVSQVQFLDKVFSIPVVVLRVSWSRQCFTQWRFRSCSSSRSSLLLSRWVPLSLSADPCCQASTLLWTIAGGAVLGQVVLARRCTTPGAVYGHRALSPPSGDT